VSEYMVIIVNPIPLQLASERWFQQFFFYLFYYNSKHEINPTQPSPSPPPIWGGIQSINQEQVRTSDVR
jgi:hypothetical protein